MKIVIFTSIIFVIFNIVNLTAVLACSCYIPDHATESLEISDAVFTGTVMKISEKKMKGNTYNAVVLKVGQIWKGVQQTEVIVYTPWSSCQFNFVDGEQYLLYAHEVDGKLHVLDCGRSATVAHATNDIQELGEGQEPNIKVNLSSELTNFSWYIVLIAILVGVIAITIFIKVRKNR